MHLDSPTPDDLDLEVYYKQPDGSLLEVGSSGAFVLVKEEGLMELPEACDYVIRVINFDSETTFIRRFKTRRPAAEAERACTALSAYWG